MTINSNNKKTFQDIILNLQVYWAKQGCTIIQPFDMEVGAGTSHPMTCLHILNPKPIAIAYVQPSRRPTDGRYGNNPNRLQHYYQFQVVIKPPPENIQDLYFKSLKEISIDLTIHDLKFIEDNWENKTLGACGVGWEIWLNGIEITQFTYFQQICGIKCDPVAGEITYGLERLAMHIQNIDEVYNLVWSDGSLGKTTYGDIFYQNEIEHSAYNFEYADTDFLFTCLNQYEKNVQFLLKLDKPLLLPAYECILKAIHSFNLLDARKAISPIERQRYILNIRKLANDIAKIYYKSKNINSL